jgi:hypothetical protein
METEDAVLRSLEWLIANQNPDKSWGKKAVCTSTSLAILCFLGNCQSSYTPIIGERLLAAMTFLIDFGGKHGTRYSEAPEDTPRALHEQAIAMVAVAETYSFTNFSGLRIPSLRESVDAGSYLLRSKDLTMAGWEADHWNDSELVTMAWQLDAYSAMRTTNLKLKNLGATIETMLRFHNRGNDLATSANNTEQAILFCTLQDRLATKDSGNDRKATHFKHLLTEPVDWSKSERLPIWFFITNLCFQEGGDIWNEWQKSCINQILAHQNSDGSFAAQPDKLLPYCPSTADDKIHRTCYATLILESYYRHQRRRVE